MEFDNVNKPKHYNTHPSGIEAREVNSYLIGPLAAAYKYVFRANVKHSSPLEDYKKARWYVEESQKRCRAMLERDTFPVHNSAFEFWFRAEQICLAETCPKRAEILRKIPVMNFTTVKERRDLLHYRAIKLLDQLIAEAEPKVIERPSAAMHNGSATA